MGCIEASRIGTGRKLWLTYEIQGSEGALFYSQERMNELNLYRHTEPSAERGYKTIFVGPDHPNYAAFFPIAGYRARLQRPEDRRGARPGDGDR